MLLGAEPARDLPPAVAGGLGVVLLGGVPFDEDIVMWWNFVGRTHDEIVEYREEWQARAARFGSVSGWRDDQYLPAPPLPTTRLKPRRRNPQ